MKKRLILSPVYLSDPSPTPESVVEEILYEQVADNEAIYSSKDFFDARIKEYKEIQTYLN